MAGDVSNPPPGILPDFLQWKEPERKPPTEQQRAAEEAKLTAFAMLGDAIGGAFDVTAAMHAKGMKTGAELDAERANAERVAARDAADKAETAAVETGNARADELAGDAVVDDVAARIAKRAGKIAKKAVKAALKGG